MRVLKKMGKDRKGCKCESKAETDIHDPKIEYKESYGYHFLGFQWHWSH